MTATRPTSVTHVLWSGNVGGIERLVHQLALCQRESGVAVTVAFAQARGPFFEAIRDSGLAVRDLGIRSGYHLSPGRIRGAARELGGADVVHLHAFNLPLGAAVSIARRPIVFTEHGNFGAGRRLGISGRLRRVAQRAFLRRACAELAANSAWTAERMIQMYGIAADRVSVIHNGIEGAASPTGSSRERGPGLVVAYVGRLAGFKRVDRLLRALSRVPERVAIEALIVGEGPLERPLKALASRLGCDSQVKFVGYRPDVEAILSAADVLVQPSQGEPFGLVVLEACRQGALPVVFADGGGALEILPPDGRVVADEAELAELLGELADDPTTSEERARRARAGWAVREFPIARTASAYLALYGSALEHHGARSARRS